MGDDYLRRTLAVTTDDVQALARKYLDPDQAAVVVYRPDRQHAGGAGRGGDARAARRCARRARGTRRGADRSSRRRSRRGLRAEREEAGVRVFRTPAGVPLLVRRKPGAMVHAGVYALGGARDEPADERGTHVAARAHVAQGNDGGAARIRSPRKASCSAGASPVGVGRELRLDDQRAGALAPQAIELLADVVQHPTIPDEALETERAIALADLVALRDDMYRYPVRLATQAAFAGHPYGVPVTGDERTLPTISADMLREWHRARVLEAPAVIGVVGDAEPAELAALAADAFGELHGGTIDSLAAPSWPATWCSASSSARRRRPRWR